MSTGIFTPPFGEAVLGGARPAFWATRNSNQTIANNAETKVQYDDESFDTNSNYDNATNYRFTPTVAGYYYITASVAYDNSVDTAKVWLELRKNGTGYARNIGHASNTKPISAWVDALVYMNGSTDYIEVFTLQDTGGDQTLMANDIHNFFGGMRFV